MKKYNTLQEVVMALKDNNQKGITIIDRNDNRRTKTYSDFFSSVFCQAAFLLQQGYQKGERVVVLVSDALKELELFWALIMIGAVPIPIVISDLTLDNQKEEKIRGALKATSPDRMLVDSVTKYSLESVLSGDIQQSPVVQIVSDLDKTLTDFDKPEFQTVQTDDPAIILLSSGTVGVPKGIILTHNNILSAVVGNVDFHNFTEQTTFLNWMVMEHMASVSLFHILPTVLQANQVHVATLRVLENATRLPEYLSEFQVNATFAPNFVYDLLLQKREEILPLDITLSSVTAIINGGEFVVILGQSGAGKSTVLNLLGGMDQPTSGKITVDGRLISEMNDQELSDYRATDIGFIFQFYNLLPMLTAYENIAITKEIVDDTLNPDEILKLVGLEHCRNKFPVHLSGGEQQRVSIARALCKNPKFLLGDEPTGALDSQTGQEVLTLIQNMCRNYGRTTILVTHNEDIARCADKVIKMKNGKIITIEKNDNPALVSEVDW